MAAFSVTLNSVLLVNSTSAEVNVRVVLSSPRRVIADGDVVGDPRLDHHVGFVTVRTLCLRQGRAGNSRVLRIATVTPLPVRSALVVRDASHRPRRGCMWCCSPTPCRRIQQAFDIACIGIVQGDAGWSRCSP
jgi:hypothetical protein